MIPFQGPRKRMTKTPSRKEIKRKLPVKNPPMTAATKVIKDILTSLKSQGSKNGQPNSCPLLKIISQILRTKTNLYP